MTSWADGWRVGLAAAALPSMASGCDLPFGGCTEIGCVSEIRGEVDLPQVGAGYAVTVCLDERCVAGTLERGDSADSFPCAALTGPITAQVCRGGPGWGSSPESPLTVRVGLDDSENWMALVFVTVALRLLVVDPQGVTVLDEARSVPVRHHYPNGDGCDDGCWQGSVRF